MKFKTPRLTFAFFSLAAGAIVGAWAFPYYLIPSDDRSFLLDPNPTSPRPVFMLLLWAAKRICDGLHWPHSQAWWILLVTSYCVTGWLVGTLADRLTRNRVLAFVTGLVFFTTPWTGAYFFWGNYAPIAGVFALMSLALLWNPNPSRAQLLASGVLVGAYFWSSPQGLLWLGALGVWYFLQHGRVREFAWVAMAALVTVALGLPSSGVKILTHWQDNLNPERFRAFEQALGFFPTIPWVSFLRASWVHQQLYAALLGIGILLFAAAVARRIKIPRPYYALAWLAFGWGLLIDLLPFTKLGRTHYLAVPFSLLFSVPFLFWFTDRLPLKLRKLSQGLVLSFLACLVVDGGLRIQSVRAAKQSAWNFAAQNGPVAILATDIHGWHWRETLVEARIPVEVLPHPAALARGATLLVGPHGPASGRTALRAALAPDWTLTEEALIRAGLTKVASFPAYGYLPPFALESEFAESLYFHGLMPSPRDPLLQMTFWRR